MMMEYKETRVETVEVSLIVLHTSIPMSSDNLVLKEWLKRQVDTCDIGYNVGSVWELGIDVEFECNVDRVLNKVE